MQVKLKFPSFGKFGLRKLPRLSDKTLIIIFGVLLAVTATAFYSNRAVFMNKLNVATKNKFTEIVNKTPTPSPSPSPTPRPLTFVEMEALYGPCVRLPVLMYHHIQTKESAVSNHQTALTVDTDIFKAQMQYLKDKNYSVLTMNDLINFFDNGVPPLKHSVLLTFDDGYQDFYTNAFPIIQSLGFHATMFVPTGLIQNPDYLIWDEIVSMNGLVYFANHTWSHKSVLTQISTMQTEISTADTQLAERGLNNLKIFAYPYGPDTMPAENYLNSIGYKAAFTTVPGNVLCKKQRFALPRIRIGNTPLSYYGF